MLEFKKPEMSDQNWVTQIMRQSGELACEYCFGNLYMWSAVYNNTIARYGDLFIGRDGNDRPMYLFPCGEGCGYAGGIMSAAVDGIKTAIAIADKFGADKSAK